MVKKALLLIIGVSFAMTASAQTARWLVRPQYDDINQLSNSVFKCKTNDKVQLVDINGKEILTSPVDSVTNFSEGFALTLVKSSNKFKIKGIVDEKGIITQVSGEYFANQYSFFSGELVSVVGESGKSGYLNNRGVLVIPCQYRFARPFVKGWASVEPAKKKKQTIYIDPQRNKLKIRGSKQGDVVMGSSFNQEGKALIAYYGDDNAVIDTEGKVVRKYDRNGDFVPIRAYDFSFDESGKDFKPDPFPQLRFDSEISTFTSGQLKGYKKGEQVVLPPQFSGAGQFVNGCAIVSQNNKFGIVKLADGHFSGAFAGEDLLVAAGKEPPTYTYTLELPDIYSIDELQILVDNGDGKMQPVDMRGRTFSFTPFVNKDAEVCVMRMEVKHGGLVLWTDSLEKSVTSVSLDISTPIALSERANDQDIIQVQSVITNNSDTPVNVSGSFSVNFAKKSKNKVGQKRSFWGKIAPKGKMEVFVDLNVIEEETAKVSVTVKVNQKNIGTKTTNLQLKPFY